MNITRAIGFTLSFTLCAATHGASPEAEWRHNGYDAAFTRFSPLDQITRENVASLERAWTFRTGDIAEDSAHYAECTPLVVDGILYVITSLSRLITVDATTGEKQWTFDPDPPLDQGETGAGGLASRGVTYSETESGPRVYLPVRDGRIYAIDITTHAPDPAFGNGGHIKLRDGLSQDGRFLFLSSPPAIYGNVLLQPFGIDDSSSKQYDYVPLRAYDTRTGALLWTFDTVPQPGQFGHETWAGDSWKHRAGCNPWTAIAVDEARGVFYASLGAPNSDKYGGDRHGDNLFGNCLVALDALTGKRLWHFQAVHHDVWDYDLPAPPNVMNVTRDGVTIPAVAVAGKTGFVYLFDRRDGTPVFPIEERPVPQSDIPGERTSPTQPFPTKPPAFARQRFSRDDLHSADTRSLRALQKEFDTLRSAGLFTPPSKDGSIVLPGQLGGANWSGAAVSPDGMMYVTANELPYTSKMRAGKGPFGGDPTARHFRDRHGNPAIKPPWGTLTKLDLNEGTLLWQVPLGDPPNGQMNFGGATATAGGLVFVAASMDAKFRAFDAGTGATLFETQLEAAGYGAPICYQGADGKQYVALFAGGGGKAGTRKGDYVIAFRLP